MVAQVASFTSSTLIYIVSPAEVYGFKTVIGFAPVCASAKLVW